MTVYHIEDNKYVCRGKCLEGKDILEKYLLNCYSFGDKYNIIEAEEHIKSYWLEHWRV